MKYSSNLRSRIALFALMPGILCSILIGAYLTYALVRDIAQYEKQMGNAYSEQIANQTFAAVQTGNVTTLAHTAQLALEYPLLRSITFYDANQQALAHAGPVHKLPGSISLHTDLFTSHNMEIESTEYRQLFVPITQPRLVGSFTGASDNDVATDHSVPIGWIQIEFSHSFLMLHKYRTILFDIIVVFILLVGTFWTVISFSDHLSDTLKKLAKNARSIGKGGNEPALPYSNITEVQDLSDAIENMQASLAGQQTNLQHNIDQATQDLRETLETIEIQNIELDLARREAVQASKIKSEFLANTSHEIRTPLNSIIGFSKLLLKTALSTQQQDYLQNIRKSSENLLTLINDVLDLSKIEAGKLVLDYVSFDINETLEDILQILAPGAHDKGLELLQIVYSDVPRQLLGDPLRLKQVLTNLISNAIKFSDQGNIVVRIATEISDAQQVLLKIEVTDPGKGLPNNNQMIFNTFTQLDSSSTRKHGGTGLGLAISRKIVEQMGGDIGYHSEPGNTTFWFTVRFDIADGASANKNTDLLRNCHILVFDREKLCRLTLSHSLTAWGAQPILADSLEQIIPALDRYAGSEHPVDAVLLGLSVSYGQQEIQQLVQAASNIGNRCPVLLCIPTSARQELLGACNNKIGLLPKPITENRLSEALCDALKLGMPTRFPESTVNIQREPNHSAVVLAVDDNPSNLKLISTMLQDLGVVVIEACNGEDAVEIFKKTGNISIVFMDIQMPVMDGIEATRKIRQLENSSGKHTPVIALTAHALAEQRQNMLMSGLDDYLSKPASEQQLMHMLEKWCWPQKAQNSKPPTDIHYTVFENKLEHCVDRASALQACGNRAELATEMLEILLNRLNDERELINAAISNNDMSQAEIYIHKLHGASCYCGVANLKNCCSAMETLIKKNMMEHLPDVVTRFNEAVDDLLAWKNGRNLAEFFSQHNH
jgi:two-component system sensor histidine kinase BarA